MRILKTYTEEERQSLYEGFISVWNETPDFVKHRFLKEQNCVLCKKCFDEVGQTQAAVKADKIAKYGNKNN